MTQAPRIRPEEAAHLRGVAIAALALRDLAGFTAATSPGYVLGRWHERLCRELEAFMDDCTAGLEPRLILQAPPRHGKTEIVGRHMGPAYMARRPGARVLYATHTQQPHADMVSLDARRLVEERLAPYLPHMARTEGRKWTANLWETRDCGWLAVGAGVGTSGMGAHMAVVDDPFGSDEDASSPAQRARVWRWYLADIETRLMGGGGIVVMHTRWHEDDLAGRLQREQPGVWRVLSWPAIAEDTEPDRKPGDALVPHLYARERLESIRGRVGERVWASLYQQRPNPEGGGMFKRQWFRNRYQGRPEDIAASADEVVVSTDAAEKAGESNDFCAIQAWARKGTQVYLLDRVCARMEYPEYVRAMARMHARWKPWRTCTVGEDAGHFVQWRQQFAAEVGSVVAFTPGRDTPGKDKGKEARARFAVGPAEAGDVWLPEEGAVSWVEDWLDTICAFPRGVHDDEVDAWSQLHVRWSQRLPVDMSEWEGISLAV